MANSNDSSNGFGVNANLNGRSVPWFDADRSTNGATGSMQSQLRDAAGTQQSTMSSPIAPLTSTFREIILDDLSSIKMEFYLAKERIRVLEDGFQRILLILEEIHPGSANKFSPTSHKGPFVTGQMAVTSSTSQHRRNRRNGTPERAVDDNDASTKPPQDDRCLLSNFFDDIKKWALIWTRQNIADEQSIMGHQALKDFVGDPTNLQAEDRPEEKHAILLEQQTLYQKIKDASDHSLWREDVSAKFAVKMLEKLGFLVQPERPMNRGDSLQELYIKGYRIGFRFRMSALKWRMDWPAPGTNFNSILMVNESRELHGTVIETFQTVSQNELSYKVRFAMSPTIYKHDYTKTEPGHREEIVHSALVHIVRKDSHIGVERGF